MKCYHGQNKETEHVIIKDNDLVPSHEDHPHHETNRDANNALVQKTDQVEHETPAYSEDGDHSAEKADQAKVGGVSWALVWKRCLHLSTTDPINAVGLPSGKNCPAPIIAKSSVVDDGRRGHDVHHARRLHTSNRLSAEKRFPSKITLWRL
eukprot:CAMPEP_0194540684 /NCGR_PEP_ID=MMETSP0253-20130528/80976_1 /TAXON_ID=2966 /ORGANISM="Noctiluca scintillans" /LENGTH=150 /DNA_ID=CAMNT_0039387079 /DNA_START=599 /DNA_END=1051 /DNA_ORIENTATION=+